MLTYFVPDVYINDLCGFDYAVLIQHGISTIACDIDNTLVAHDEAVADARASAFLDDLKKQGFQIILVSNNWKSRVSTFAKSVNLPYVSFAKKPLPFVYHKICRLMHCEMKQLAVIGDQMLTDVLGAKLAGAFAVLCEPAVNRDLTCTKINRQVEKVVCRWLKKKHLFYKGRYYNGKDM